MSIRVLLVDDQALIRAGFRMILDAEDDMDVVGECADGTQAVDSVRRLKPDVVLMDIRMPEMDGIEMATAAAREFPTMKIMLMTGYADQRERAEELTPRELEVFKLIARGMSNAEIAAELVVSETTVKTHVARVLMKLGVRDRVQAVVLAYESGVVAPGATSSE
jgi:DNA-binding NarL/FixJ family response regulator